MTSGAGAGTDSLLLSLPFGPMMGRSEFSQPSVFIHLFIHPFIHSLIKHKVNPEPWGLRENLDAALPSLLLPPRHRAPGSRWRDERVTLEACGPRGGGGELRCRQENEASPLFRLGGRLRAKPPWRGWGGVQGGGWRRHPMAHTHPLLTLFSVASSSSPTSNLSSCSGVTS